MSLYREADAYRGADTYRGAGAPPIALPVYRSTFGAPWRTAAARARLLRAPSLQAQALAHAVQAPFEAAKASADSTALPWRQSTQAGTAKAARWQQADPAAPTTVAAPFDQAQAVDQTTAAPWGTATPQADTLAARWAVPAQINAALSAPWGSAQQRDLAVAAFWRAAAARGAVIALPWGPAGQRQLGVGTPWPVDPNPGDPGGTLHPIIREAYIMTPTVSAVVLPGRAPLNVISVRLAADVDSYGWQGSAQISFADLASVRPDPDPIEVEISINGYTWVMIVDDYSDNRRFGARTATLSLRSRSALLDAPFAPPRTGLPDEARTANQLGDEQLFGTGWTLVWDAVDWLVPGERWSYQDATAMQALGELAAAIGAGIETARTTLELQVRPRYPASPWDWGTATPYAAIPAHIIASLSGGAARGPGANGVYVFDGAGSGALVRIDGTAGEVQATQIVERLLANEDALQERGRIEIARGGRVSTHSLQIPLFPSPAAPGLLPLRALLQVTEPPDPADPGAPVEVWRGQVMAVAIDADRAGGPNSVRQTLTLERHHHD